MSKTIRHKNTKYQKFCEVVDKQYVPQNEESKLYQQRGICVPQHGSRAYNGHKSQKNNGHIYSGILRAKLKSEFEEMKREFAI